MRNGFWSVVLPLIAVNVWAQQPVVSAPVPAAPAAHAHAMPAPRAQLGSSAALAPDGRLWLVGVNAQGALFVQTSAAADVQQWGAPRVLDTQGDAVAANGESRPKLAFGPEGRVVIAYTLPLKNFAGMIRMLRSTDAGQTFSAPFTVHADRQEITHRFESIAFDAQGALHTVWIDRRDQNAAPKVGGKSSYRGAAIYRNVSLDGGATFGPDIRVADHSCECCRIALAVGTDGRMHAMWRHVFAPNVRDHATAVLDATPPAVPVPLVRATFDDWHVNACPDHGPSLAAAPDGGFHAVWFGIRKQGDADVAGERYARLHPDGSPMLDTVRPLPDENAEHADVQAFGARVAVVWRSVDGARSTLKAWLSTDGGQTFHLKVLGDMSGANDVPHLVQQGPRMLVVWRSANEVQVHELTF